MKLSSIASRARSINMKWKKKLGLKLKMPQWFFVSFFSLMFLYFRRESVGEYYNGDHDQDKVDPGTEVDVL